MAAVINQRTISSGKGFVHCSLTELNMANSAYFHLVKNSINYKLLIFFLEITLTICIHKANICFRIFLLYI